MENASDMTNDNPKNNNKTHSIEELRTKIDFYDSTIVEYILLRTNLSHEIGIIKSKQRINRVDPLREENIRETYRQLGAPGIAIADALLELGRGKIGND